jgi:hypothetical protein
MNTYTKYAPNVFLAKCTEKHEKGDIIPVTTQYGKENDSIVFKLIAEKDGFYYYSIVRADGYNLQQRALNKAAKLTGYANNAEKRANDYYERSQEGREFLALAEPIKVGHHSEKRHRALIERNWNRMGNSVAESKKAEEYNSRAESWAAHATDINLSMPESVEYYAQKLAAAKEKHEGLKSGKIERSHSYSLTYAKKEVNEMQKLSDLAVKLWA